MGVESSKSGVDLLIGFGSEGVEEMVHGILAWSTAVGLSADGGIVGVVLGYA